MLDAIRKNAQSWGVKLLFGLIIIVFVFWGVGSFTGDQANVVAYVNEEPITLSEFREAYDQSLESLRASFGDVSEELIRQIDFKRQVLSQLVDTRLLLSKAETMGITASDAEVRLRIAKIKAFHNAAGAFDEQIYRQVLAGSNLTPAVFEADLKRQMRLQKITESVALPAQVTDAEARRFFVYANEKAEADYAGFAAEDYLGEVSVSEEEIATFYHENQARFTTPQMIGIDYFLFTPAALARPDLVPDEKVREVYEANKDAYVQEEQVHARHILFSVPEDADDALVAEAEKKARQVREKIAAGADFAAMAREYSEGPSAPSGGDLGWFGRGRMVPPFEQAAFELEPGEVSEPVRTRFGFHLIKVEEAQKAEVAEFDEVKARITRRLAEDAAAEKMADLMDEALVRLTMGEDPAEVAEALDVPLRRSGLFAASNPPEDLGLSPDEINTLFAMEQGDVTETPFAVEGGYLLAVKTKEREPEPVPLEDVSDAIKAEILRQKAIQAARTAATMALDEVLKLAPGDQPPADLAARLERSGPFTRQGPPAKLDVGETFVEDAFAAQPGQWLPAAYDTPKGAVVARLAEITTPGDEQWRQQKKLWLSTLTERKQRQLFEAFMADLRQGATIKITQPEMFDN